MSNATRPPTMPDVVAAGIHWTAAQAEFNAACKTHDNERVDHALDAYDAASEQFNAAVLGYVQRLPAYRDLLAACNHVLAELSDQCEGRRDIAAVVDSCSKAVEKAESTAALARAESR